jgi:hypothetical protein
MSPPDSRDNAEARPLWLDELAAADRWLVTLDGRDRSTVGEHFGEWTAALALVKELGFPEETKAWPIARLSTGERLRLALIRALMMRPKGAASRRADRSPRYRFRGGGRGADQCGLVAALSIAAKMAPNRSSSSARQRGPECVKT